MIATHNDTAPQTQASKTLGEAQRTQAERVIGKFGGACKLAKLLGAADSTIFRWTYSKANGGTDGIIPGHALRHVLRVAREQGISITPADLYPT